MAALKQCDGCDKIEKEGSLTNSWRRLDIQTVEGDFEFDLCGGCYKEFVDKHLPTKWIRSEAAS